MRQKILIYNTDIYPLLQKEKLISSSKLCVRVWVLSLTPFSLWLTEGECQSFIIKCSLCVSPPSFPPSLPLTYHIICILKYFSTVFLPPFFIFILLMFLFIPHLFILYFNILFLWVAYFVFSDFVNPCESLTTLRVVGGRFSRNNRLYKGIRFVLIATNMQIHMQEKCEKNVLHPSPTKKVKILVKMAEDPVRCSIFKIRGKSELWTSGWVGFPLTNKWFDHYYF